MHWKREEPSREIMRFCGRILTTAVCRHPPLYRLAPGSLITVWLLVANITAVRQALVCFAKMNQALNPEGIVDP